MLPLLKPSAVTVLTGIPYACNILLLRSVRERSCSAIDEHVLFPGDVKEFTCKGNGFSRRGTLVYANPPQKREVSTARQDSTGDPFAHSENF